MYEFGFRLISAGMLICVSGWLGVPDFESAWQIALLTVVYATVAYLVEHKKKTNSGFAGLIAGLDALAIAAVLAFAGYLESFGLLVVAPMLYAVTRRGSNPLATGAITASAVFFAQPMVSGGLPSTIIYVQTAIVFALSLLVNQPRVVVRPKSIQEMINELAVPEVETGTQALIELREKYRRLTRTFRELERRSRVARWGVELMLARHKRNQGMQEILEKIREMSHADGVILYTINQLGNRLLITETNGRVPKETQSISIQISGEETAYLLKKKTTEALSALSAENKLIPTLNVILSFKGTVVGMLTLFLESRTDYDSLQSRMEEASEIIARVVLDEQQRIQHYRRTREAEILYEIACRTDGATTEADICKRTAKALCEILQCEGVGVYLLDEGKPILAGKQGRVTALHESLLFDPQGIEGWLKAGGESVFAYSILTHSRIDKNIAIKQRVGSYLLVPILHGIDIIGFLIATDTRDGKFHEDDSKTLTDIATELAHAIVHIKARKNEKAYSPSGFLTPSEFQNEVLSISPDTFASIVYVEPLRFNDLLEEVGQPTIELASRQLGLLIKRLAPNNARLCRKADGSYAVLLPEMRLSDSQLWANELMAVAAMRVYDSSETFAPVPLAVRARVADLNENLEAIRHKSETAA